MHVALGIQYYDREAGAFRDRAQSFRRQITAWQKKRSDVDKKVSGR